MTCICQCNVITDVAARRHAENIDLHADSTTRTAAQIFRSACNGKGKGCCMANFEDLVEKMKAEGWKPANQPAAAIS